MGGLSSIDGSRHLKEFHFPPISKKRSLFQCPYLLEYDDTVPSSPLFYAKLIDLAPESATHHPYTTSRKSNVLHRLVLVV